MRQLQLSFMETASPDKVAPVWAVLDEAQRNQVVEILARLIAQVAVARDEAPGPVDKEKGDD